MSALPDFFIAGAPRAGTTSLYHDFQGHPAVCMSKPKETWYFFDHQKYEEPIDWYASHFFGHCSDHELIGEATPLYMAHPESPRRIFESLDAGNLQFFFLLRDPVERAVSHYHFEIQQGARDPSRSFSEVIRDPVAREVNPSENHVGLLEIGCYIKHIKRYEKYFDRNQINPILFGDYVKNRKEVVIRIFESIGLNGAKIDKVGEPASTNPTKYPISLPLFRFLKETWTTVERSLGPAARWLDPVRKVLRQGMMSTSWKNPQLNSDDQSYLSDYYADFNASLSNYLDRDLSHWK